jgi:hypothetical protein
VVLPELTRGRMWLRRHPAKLAAGRRVTSQCYTGLVWQRNTLETNPTTTVLVIGGPPLLTECVERSSRTVPRAEVITCELRDAANRVAELWPFAIIMSDDLYAFDSAEFDALARDVRSRLIVVPAATTPKEAELGPRILEAFRWRMKSL